MSNDLPADQPEILRRNKYDPSALEGMVSCVRLFVFVLQTDFPEGKKVKFE